MTLSGLPIPSRAQTDSEKDELPVKFPVSISSCVSCKPSFFASPACVDILALIAERTNDPSSSAVSAVPNDTVFACQCNPSFKIAYGRCLDCFRRTNQLGLVFGDPTLVPSPEGIEAYCKQTTTKTAHVSTTTASSPTPSSKVLTDTKPEME
ncbi:hypothetical protein BGW41_007100 [Actinomortierella wolfii]|nr:hypothetical protein BGW41_007100 [Actinomortierella wolfii]